MIPFQNSGLYSHYVGLITAPGRFWKRKLLNVLVKEGLSLIRRGDNQRAQQR